MAAPTQDEFAAIVAAIEAKGLKVVHADKFANHGRMITVVVDEGDPDNITVFEIWPEGFMPDQVAEKAASARETNGPGLVYEIGDNPITDDYVPAGWDTTISGKPIPEATDDPR